jgi:anti-sigma B factor antagonist
MSDVRSLIETVSGVPVVTAPAEIDFSNADWLRATLLKLAAAGHATLIVDMSRTQFCDSAALRVLVRAQQRMAAEGGELRLVVCCAAVLRVFAVTGVDRVIQHFASLAEALGRTPRS